MLSTSSCNRLLLLLLRQIRTTSSYRLRYVSHTLRYVTCVYPGQAQRVNCGCWAPGSHEGKFRREM